jgi:hypothetical protein
VSRCQYCIEFNVSVSAAVTYWFIWFGGQGGMARLLLGVDVGNLYVFFEKG